MDNNVTTSEKITKWLLIGISVLFLAVMLLLLIYKCRVSVPNSQLGLNPLIV